MLSGEAGSGRGRAILYARVSTTRQARGGYSLAQQLEALRGFAARKGYGVLEEVADAAQSGATLHRPGLDRARDLVAAGGVDAVLVQDVDRLARDPEHHMLLQHELGKHGCEIVALNGLGASGADLAGHEVARTTERSLRGKRRKAREGKILAGHSARYGFRFNAARDGYLVDEATMPVVRRIFNMLGVEKRTLYAVKGALEAGNVSTPTGRRRWSTNIIRGFVIDDVYRPHPFREIASLLTPEVAARLDPDGR